MTKQELAKAIVWMMDKGYATGHGDTVVDLLQELEWQVAEREREACARVCENMERNGAWITKEEAAAAIRANRSLVTTSVDKPNYCTTQVTPQVTTQVPGDIDRANVGEVGVWGEK